MWLYHQYFGMKLKCSNFGSSSKFGSRFIKLSGTNPNEHRVSEGNLFLLS